MTTVHPEVLSGPADWRGPEMAAQGGWEYRLTEAEIAEVDAAVAAIDRPLIEVDRTAFPLPTLGPKLGAQAKCWRAGGSSCFAGCRSAG